jgi:hypothetical protein
LRVQKNFFEFERIACRTAKTNVVERISWSFSFVRDKKSVLVRCLNTALFSRLKETGGQLFFPVQAIPAAQDGHDIAVTMFHHPYGWLSPDNSREFRRTVESTSDLVLTGHEHDGDSYTRITRTGEETGYVEGAALQGSTETGFNLIVIDLPANTYQVHRFLWAEDMYRPSPSEARVFARKQTLIGPRFRNNPDFWQRLNDVGTGFSHPIKELTIRDLFVYPELRLASISAKSQINIQSSGVLDFVAERNFIHIAGPSLSGKSTLARVLYLDLQREHQLTPLLLNAKVLSGTSEPDIEKAIEKAFGEQYEAGSYERFRQLDISRKVLLIDDWHCARIRSEFKGRLLTRVRARFGKVVVLSDDISLFQLLTESADGEGEVGDIPTAEYWEIKQFGYRLRSDLLNLA